MKNYSLSPTDENAIRMLREDTLGRREAVFRFVDLLEHIDESCSIALNGDWGSGKTFFVKQVKAILDCNNPQSQMLKKSRQEISCLTNFAFSRNRIYSTVYYDAWTNDSHDDPLLSIIYATITSHQSEFSATKKRSIMETAASIADAVTGRSISDILKNVKGTDWLSSIKDAEDIRSLVKRFLDALILEHRTHLVVFIDELDRCKPDYAVRLLERIKHYFDDTRVTFVFSVCLSELQWTIKAHYGEGFNAIRYLDKFFDLRVDLPTPSISDFLTHCVNFDKNPFIFNVVCIETVKYFNFSLREIERYIRLVKICGNKIAYSSEYHPSVDVAFFVGRYILPVMIGLKMIDVQAYNDFLTGKNPDVWIRIFSSPDLKGFQNTLSTDSEKFLNAYNAKVAPEEKLKSSLKEIYTAIFKPRTFADSYGLMDYEVISTQKTIGNISTLLSSFCDYNFE